MQGKGIIRFFAIALIIVCLFQLSFTLKTYLVEGTAREFGEQKAQTAALSFEDLRIADPIAYYDTMNLIRTQWEQRYLDSIANLKVYNLLLVQYTYDQVKDNQLSLGLDLQGGMSVIMQVSVEDILVGLAGNNKDDQDFKAAIARARTAGQGSEADFVTNFANAYAEITNNGRLAAIYSTRQNQGLIEPDYSNDQITEILKLESTEAVDRTFEILTSRIDQFGVTSPNISRVENSDRIFIELPGVSNPTRVRKLLQAAASLEFWETYKFEDVAQNLMDADAVVRQMLGFEELDTDTTAQENEPETIEDSANGDDSLANEETDLEVGAIAETTSTDSPDVDPEFPQFDPEEGFEEFNEEEVLKQNPLLYRMNFNDNFRGGPMVGWVAPKDTLEVNRFLRMPEVAASFPPEMKLLWSAKANTEGFFELYAIKKNPLDNEPTLGGEVISNAMQEFDQNGRPNIVMVMNSEGASRWARITAANVGREVAIVLDNVVYSAPTVQGEIRGGRSEITGNFSIMEAKDMANKLKSGKLPAPARIMQESIVGPTLGAESIRAGVISLVSGLVLVLLFMMFYYARGGVVANAVLALNIFYIFGLLASLGATLTLPGIAGIVLTIGMAVDANVIIYERIREELLKGKSIRTALIDGYGHSYSAIIDANATTLLTAGILFYFGLGPVKGFATVLIIGILTSLFTAVLLSRVIFEWMLKRDMKVNMGNKLTVAAFQRVNIDWLSKRKVAYIISGVVIAIGLVSFVARGFELGVDFKGGRSYHIRFEQPVNAQAVRQSLGEAFGATPIVKTVGSANELKITTAYMIDTVGQGVDSIVEVSLMSGLKAYLPTDRDVTHEEFNTRFVLESITVQPTIAQDIKSRAIVATIIALIAIFLYILLRFKKWQYSAGALIALAHDVLIVMGIFSLGWAILPFSMEINQAFIAAILTVIGYSMNDTVIVYDRIREEINEGKKGQSLMSRMNLAINFTLSRTLITSGTTMLVLLVLFLFGGEAIRGFSFAILIGILIGTYSSIFIAAPVMFDLSKGKEDKLIEPKMDDMVGDSSRKTLQA